MDYSTGVLLDASCQRDIRGVQFETDRATAISDPELIERDQRPACAKTDERKVCNASNEDQW